MDNYYTDYSKFKPGDRVRAIATYFYYSPWRIEWTEGIGTVLDCPGIRYRDWAVLIEFDEPLIFPGGGKGHDGYQSLGKDGYCSICWTADMELLEEGKNENN